MKICLAQIKPTAGNITENIERHSAFVHSAIYEQADLIVFPELSLTGYEPTLASSLAMDLNDTRLDIFQKLSNKRKITIGVGAPTINKDGVCISLILFHPQTQKSVYSKHYLHKDEEPCFISGPNMKLPGQLNSISLAICYELSVPEHANQSIGCNTSVYLASVSKTATGVLSAQKRLREIALKHAVMTLMVNAVGSADGDVSAGQSAIWDRKGQLVDRLDEACEGILILDTEKTTTRRIAFSE